MNKDSKLISYADEPALMDLSFEVNASGFSREGKEYLYFGGSNGFVKFSPAEIKLWVKPSKMKLNQINIGGIKLTRENPLNSISTIEVRHSDHYFTIDYTVIDNFNATNVEYRHQLGGYDINWRDTNNHGSATYTNLPPGNYTFRAQGTNSSGIRSEEEIVLQVIVHPPPWRTWWAYSLYCLATLFLVWVGWRWHYTYRLKEEAAAMAREMNLEAEYVLDELQEQLDAQDTLLSAVHQRNLISLQLLRNTADIADSSSSSSRVSHTQKNIAALTSLENALLQHQDRLFADMHACVDDMASKLLETYQERRDAVTIINEVSKRPVEADLGAQLAVVIYELISHAIEGSMEGTGFGNYIKVVLDIKTEPGSSSREFNLSVSSSGEELSDLSFTSPAGVARVVAMIGEAIDATITTLKDSGSGIRLQFTREMAEL